MLALHTANLGSIPGITELSSASRSDPYALLGVAQKPKQMIVFFSITTFISIFVVCEGTEFSLLARSFTELSTDLCSSQQ